MTDTNHRRTGKVQVERLIDGARDTMYKSHSQTICWSKKKKRLRRKERRKGAKTMEGDSTATTEVKTMVQGQFQCRSEETGLSYWATFKAALKHAEEDASVWKISFSLPTGERVRLVLRSGTWVYEPII